MVLVFGKAIINLGKGFLNPVAMFVKVISNVNDTTRKKGIIFLA